MATPDNHDEDPLPPLPPAPEPGPLPAPLEEQQQADQQALLAELAEQLSADDAAPPTPTAEVRGLTDLELQHDPLFPSPKRPTAKQKAQAKNDAHAEFLKQAETFTAAPAPAKPAPPPAPEKPAQHPLMEPIPGGTPGQLAAQAALLKSLEELSSPIDVLTDSQAEFSQEFRGEPSRDYGQQVFPQGDQANDTASAEADLRAATEQYQRQSVELLRDMVGMFNDLAGEVARLRDRLNRGRH